MRSQAQEADDIRRMIRTLGVAGGAVSASSQQIEHLRAFFGRRALPDSVDAYILGKYDTHVGDDGHWPEDTTPDEYLESLRQTVLDPRSAIYLTDAGSGGDWSIYFVGRVRRGWRGPAGSNCLLVIFNAEHHFLVTGFQPSRDRDYVDRQGGFWLHVP